MPMVAPREISAYFAAVFLSWYFISCVVVTKAGAAAAPKLIDATESSNVYHLDLLLQQERPDAASAPPIPPWFDGFGVGDVSKAGAVAVATVGHPIRRMLVHLRQEGVRLDEAMSWAEEGGETDMLHIIRLFSIYLYVTQRSL